MRSDDFEKRFWSKVSKGHSCWDWEAARNSKGYGRFWLNGKTVNAHRLAYCLYHGLELVDIRGECICHSCDNPSCCNPEHLWLGTDADNIWDRDNKGRGNKGKKNGRAKLDEEDVVSMRRRYPTETLRKLANEFEISKSGVWSVISHRTWKHI